ncbi:MAG: hypothetical protein A2Y33_02595 [Spirochaetes bacterium GWF1_51_8]|nr:MAG: hypothetical protein A2Y33_02595 [Spirochaetes bacterium GWF1_51_8]
MIDLSEKHLHMVKNILKIFIPDSEVRVFGSRTNGKSWEYSDLDIVVYSNEKTDNNTLYQLVEAFQESDLPFRVDVLDYCTLDENFKKIVDEKNEIIQEGKVKVN